jgi:hypothetical protein
MKSKLTLLAGIVLCSSMQFSFQSSSSKINRLFEFKSVKSEADQFRVTAETKNPYGKNYWVDLIIEGTNQYGTKVIYGVYYNDGYGLKKLSYYQDYQYKGTYYVMINSQYYYFTF